MRYRLDVMSNDYWHSEFRSFAVIFVKKKNVLLNF